MNPADSARQKLKQDFSNVRKENLELKKKIKELQEGRDVSVSESKQEHFFYAVKPCSSLIIPSSHSI